MDFFIDYILNSYNYLVSIILMMIGFYIVVQHGNLIKKLIGLTVFQTSVLLFYISAAYVDGARFPILKEGVEDYVNPLPHVLMLTAIVVGIATIAVGLAIAVRIRETYGTVEEKEIIAFDNRVISDLYEVSKTELKQDDFRKKKAKKPKKKAKRVSSIFGGVKKK